MARSYRPVDRDQVFLLPPSMTDWLPQEHPVWFVIDAVGRLDTSAFHARARLGGVGRRGYDPDMMVTLLVYAMACGLRSSRKIEQSCHTDVAYRIICAGDVPHFTVLCRFRQDHEAALGDLLTASLVLAAELGMVRLGVVAFDGTKIAANAAKAANRSEAGLRRLAAEHLAGLEVTDRAEDAVFGEGTRGDEIPEALHDRTRRGARIAAALEQIAAAKAVQAAGQTARAAAAEAYAQATEQAADAQGQPPMGRPPGDVDLVALAEARWRRATARARARVKAWEEKVAAAAAEGRRIGGNRPVKIEDNARVRAAYLAYERARAAAEATTAGSTAGSTGQPGQENTGQSSAGRQADAGPATTGTTTGEAPTSGETTDPAGRTSGEDGKDTAGRPPRANLTDPESRLLKTRNGYIQGYNCQTSLSADQFIVHAEPTQDANDVQQFTPTMQATTQMASHLAGQTSRTDLEVGVMIGDAGYDSAQNLAAPGPPRLIPRQRLREVNQRATADPVAGPPPPGASPREQMDHQLRTPEGNALYRRRAPLAEAPNGWMKDRRGLRSFSRRGLNAARSELRFAAAVTNLLRIQTLTTTGGRQEPLTT